MPNYHCKHCGYKATSIQRLTFGYCLRHPTGAIEQGLERLVVGVPLLVVATFLEGVLDLVEE